MRIERAGALPDGKSEDSQAGGRPRPAPEGPSVHDAFGIYVHWPFCLSKCPYCDFNSHVTDHVDHAEWRRSLLSELEHYAARTRHRKVTSIFFGGGTPSLMEPATTAALLDRIAALWPVDENVEITLEANPGTVDAARFADFRQAGINRLSMGLQALDDESLHFLGRRHDSATALNAVILARALFPRVSFDLIYARPGQTPAEWERELTRALSLGTDHLSLYQLTIEPGTAFHPAHARGDFSLPDEDLAAELFELTERLASDAGLAAYEISNHAAPGAECRHNLLYWRGQDYLGIGPGAHGRLTDESGTPWALSQYRAPQRWLAEVATHGHGTQNRISLSQEERVTELVMMGLRLAEGISAERFARQTGLALEAVLDRSGLETMIGEGFLRRSEDRLWATPKGRLVLNSVIAALLAS